MRPEVAIPARVKLNRQTPTVSHKPVQAWPLFIGERLFRQPLNEPVLLNVLPTAQFYFKE